MKTYRTEHYHGLEQFGALNFIAVMAVQHFIRPATTAYADEIKFVLGILPNFFGAIAMAVAIFIYSFKKLKAKQINAQRIQMISCALSLAGLCLWEYIQTFAHRKFDYYDILATVAGAIIASLFMYFAIRKNESAGIFDL